MPAAEPPSPPPAPRRRLRVWQRIGFAVLAVVLLVCGAVVLGLDPLVRWVVPHRSGRSIEFTALRLGLDAARQPRLTFDGLTIGNAPWARSREPLIRGARVAFEFDWAALRGGVLDIQRLVLEDAEIDLERRADGQRNSRLWDPEGLTPARTRVLRVDAQRSRLRYDDAVTGLRLEMRSSALPAARPLPGHPERTLTRQLAYTGQRGAIAFSGTADVGDVVTLQRTGEVFPLQGDIRAEGLRLEVSGLVADLLAPGRLETDLRLAVAPQPRRRAVPFDWLAASWQVDAQAHLDRDGGRWRFTGLQLQTAHSTAAGSMEFRQADGSQERSMLTGQLDAPRLEIDDLHRRHVTETTETAPPGPERVRLGALDATLDLHVGQLLSTGTVLARETRLHAQLERGALRLGLVGTRIAGGQGSGEWRLDTGRAPVESTLDLRVDGVQLEQLPLGKTAEPRPAGRLAGHAVLNARGRTLADVLGSATGTVEASLDGASISRRLEAKLGLDAFGLLRSLVDGSARVPVRCAELALAFDHGVGTVRRLALDTPRTAVSGSGSIDLVGRTLDVVMSPSSNVDALLALPRDVHVTGPLEAPNWSLQARGQAGARQRCGAG